MLILSLLRNGIGIFNQNYINMHLKNVKILTEGRWHCIVKKVMQLNMFKAEIFPRLSYSLNTTPGTLNFPSIPSEGGMFLYFLQCLWSLFIQNINVFRYLHSGGFIWWIPHAHFLNCLRLKFIPCVCSRLGSRLLRNWCVRNLYPTLGGWFLLDLHAFLELFLEDGTIF